MNKHDHARCNRQKNIGVIRLKYITGFWIGDCVSGKGSLESFCENPYHFNWDQNKSYHITEYHVKSQNKSDQSHQASCKIFHSTSNFSISLRFNWRRSVLLRLWQNGPHPVEESRLAKEPFKKQRLAADSLRSSALKQVSPRVGKSELLK